MYLHAKPVVGNKFFVTDRNQHKLKPTLKESYGAGAIHVFISTEMRRLNGRFESRKAASLRSTFRLEEHLFFKSTVLEKLRPPGSFTVQGGRNGPKTLFCEA
mmetsp:Transcript_16667/g.45797  ORF Transcript_16667/g.45797 Transcript_16667/m.45797 type:complete len:102 (-) Transcript_16667:93-398(-)